MKTGEAIINDASPMQGANIDAKHKQPRDANQTNVDYLLFGFHHCLA